MRTIFRMTLLSWILWSGVSTASIPIALEFPKGKFQVDNPPTLFKWNLTQPAASLTLKIFRTNPDGTYEVEKNLVARFDFTASTDTLTWPNAPLPQGKYVWALEAFDSRSPHPVARESAHFEIESIKRLDQRARRVALQVGFSRGKYSSQDPNYDLDYDITPTQYGLIVQGGQENTLWGVNAQMSDYVLRGGVRRTFAGSAYRLSRLTGSSTFGVETFIGPSIRVMKIPRIRSLDGVTIAEDQAILVNPGLSFAVNRGIDMHTTLYAQMTLDTPVYSDQDAKFDLSQLNYQVNGGFIYGLGWPIAIGGEIQYRMDKSITKDDGVEVKVSAADWCLLGRILYGF